MTSADHLGGQAGGEKYIYHGIIFKFATDWKGLYRGDQYAAKSAGIYSVSLSLFPLFGTSVLPSPLPSTPRNGMCR